MAGPVPETGKRFPLFFGSTVVLGCFIGMVGSTGGMLFSSLGVLANPLAAEFGWSRGEIFFAISVLTAGIILGILASGPLLDRYGSRKVLLVSVALSILVMAPAPFYVSSLPTFYLMIFLGSFIGGPTNTVAYARVVASWFDRRRGLFIGINASGMGTGFALVPLLTNQVLDNGGWHAGYYLLAGIMLLVVLPSIFLLVVDEPGDVGLEVDGKAAEQDEEGDNDGLQSSLSFSQAVKTPAFVLLVLLAPTLAFALYGTFSQLVPMMGDRGIDATVAAFIASTVGISMAVARLLVGFLLDHFFAPRLAMFLFGLSLLGVLFLLLGNHVALYFAGAMLVGFGIGAEGDLVAYLVSRYFGMAHFGTIFGCVFSAYMMGTGIGPAVFGAAFDRFGDYNYILMFSAALLVISIILFRFFAPYNSYLNDGN